MSLEFDGANPGNLVDFGTSSLLAPANITVLFWTRGLATPVQFDGLMGKTNGGAWTQGWGLFYDSGTEVRFFIEQWDTNVAFATITPANNNFVTGTWDAADVRAFVNAVEGTSDPYAGGMTDGTNPFEVGRLGTDDFNLNQIFEDVRVYSRALPLDEIETIFAVRGVDGIMDGLAARWYMAEASPGTSAAGAGSVKDWGVNALNGTPTNSPVYREGVIRSRRKVV
jgi:hypothetical protein